MKNVAKFLLGVVGFTLICAGSVFAREQIKIVGSSTVFPFSSYVAEEFGATTAFSTPVVESTGSGGGHKLFGAGVGENTPDITNSSRRMKISEFVRSEKNGVTGIVECLIGYDGIAIAQNISTPDFAVSKDELALAVMEMVPVNGKLVKNPYTFWDQINSALPKRKILFYGPPTSSGTRDAFAEMVIGKFAKKHKALYGPISPKGKAKKYEAVRQDGVYVPAGENDNLIVQKLTKDKTALGIFGYSFLEENSDRIKGAKVNGISPEPETIANGDYPISRSLFFYVKKDHLSTVPGVAEYVKLFMSDKMIGPRGLLKRIGLVPLAHELREKVQADVAAMQLLTLEDLKH